MSVLWLGSLACARALDPSRAASQYRFDEWVTTEGLVYPAVRAIGQSGDGYLWLGTRAGLTRFDGVTMTAFTAENCPEMRRNTVHCLWTGPDGTLWIGVDQGVVWYRDGAWSRPSLPPELSEKPVRAIGPGRNGTVMIGLHDRIFEWRDGQCEPVSVPGFPVLDTVSQFMLTARGELVVVGNPTLVIGDAEVRVLSRRSGLATDEIAAAAGDADGGLWIGSSIGLNYWKDGRVSAYSTRDGLPVNAVRSILIDRNRNVWFGTPNGLARYRDGRFEQVVVHGVERLSHVLSLFEDREGNLWGGTDNGLVRLSDSSFVNLTQSDGLPSNSVLCVLESRDGSKWVGTWGGGLSHVVGDRIQTVRTTDGLLEDGVRCLAEEGNGALWIAYYNRGLSRYRDGKFEHLPASEDSARAISLACDREDRLWLVDTAGALFRRDDNVLTRMSVPGLPVVKSVLAASDGSVWAGGPAGLARFANGGWVLHARPREGPRDSSGFLIEGPAGVVSLLEDRRLLHRVREGRVEKIEFPASVGPLTYGGAVADGYLWASFRFGVARVRLSDLDAAAAGGAGPLPLELFNERDGMRSRAPNVGGSPGVIVSRDGSIWIPTSKGVAITRPTQARQTGVPLQPLIETILAGRTERTARQIAGAALRDRDLEFRVTAATFADPARVVFRHRLVGRDDAWVEDGTRREIRYSSLAPGAYRIEVLARAGDGAWPESPAVLSFSILPRFHERPVFWLLVTGAVAALGAGVYRWRVRVVVRRAAALQRQNALLEKGIAERTAELARSNEALRASEYFYHSLVESLPQIILRKDAQGRIEYANTAFGQLVRRPLSEVIGRVDYELAAPGEAEALRAHDQQVMRTGQVMEQEHVIQRDGEPRRYLHCKRVPLFDQSGRPTGVQVLFWDMTRFRETEQKLGEAQRELLEASRLAGIAEMATGVLHNLGNALNSVNTSAEIVADSIAAMQTDGVKRAGSLLRTQEGPVADFLAADSKGRQLPEYLERLSTHLQEQRQRALDEVNRLRQGIEHIKEIVAAQQKYARASSPSERISPAELIETALHVSDAALRKAGVLVTREFLPAPPVEVPRQKALQILLNLLRNACDSLAEAGPAEKRLWLRLRCVEGRVELQVRDNGVGIAPQNLTRIFNFGYTTKKGGHGFGLHSCALAAREMAGTLVAESAGPGQGASFTLTLPAAPAASDSQRRSAN